MNYPDYEGSLLILMNSTFPTDVSGILLNFTVLFVNGVVVSIRNISKL